MIRRTSKNTFFPYFLFLTLSFILIILRNTVFVSIIRYPLEQLFIPLKKVLYQVRIDLLNNTSLILEKDIRVKLNQYQQASKELTVLKSKITLLEEENKSLRKQLETPLPPQWDFIPAQVLGKERFLLIDKGRQDKVEKGMVVINQDIIVGKVFLVNEKTSQVMLIFDPDSKIPAKTEKNTKGLLTGAFGNQVLFSKVLQKDPLNSLDLLLTSGEEESFPANLLIGKIDEVNAKQGEVYKEALVMPILDYDQLKHVFIISAY